ncbi:molybdate ABC transporter substrate-binding protein [Gordonia sp. DT30]|uniref:molybdate ABC transporter substrate-binding protein n=1 Tax=Gordonia sp. DT30 TaxID=3416546 RepID=UPI003CEBDD5A
MTAVSRWTRWVCVAASAALITGVAVGCSSSDDADAKTPLKVYAAASLKKTFTEIEKAYESQHPDVDVTINFDGSSALVNQIKQGADADVIATADEATMSKLGDLVDPPKIFARNTLVIVTAAGNPKNITNFGSLANPSIRTVVCAVEVPCGAATAQVERNTGIVIKPVSEESSVTAVLTKVTSGEADAGLVYVTDAKSGPDTIAVVGDRAFAKVVNNYPIATLKTSKHQQQAQEFMDLVLAQTGQKILTDAGFVTAG